MKSMSSFLSLLVFALSFNSILSVNDPVHGVRPDVLGSDSKSIRFKILEQIWNGDSPYNYVQERYIDKG